MNLDNLINELFGILKERLKKRGMSDNDAVQTRNDLIDADLRKRDLELGRQRLINEGQANVEGIRNTGELARQRLITEGTRYIADRSLEGTRHTADRSLEGTKYTADIGAQSAKHLGLPEVVKGLNAIVTSFDSTDEEKAEARRSLLNIQKRFSETTPTAPQTTGAITRDDVRRFETKAAFQAGIEPDEKGKWPSKFKREGHPDMIVNGVNTKTGLPIGQGQKSMEFRAEGSISPEQIEAAEKKRKETYWYGTKHQNERKKRSIFDW